MVIGINQPASRIDLTNWRIFSGLPSALPTLNGDGLPAVAFKCAVTLSSVTGHTDVAGSVTVGGETLTFTVAARKTTTVSLSALPAISTTGLDCNVLVEAITIGGANILHESTTAILVRFRKAQKEYADAMGEKARSEAIADTTDLTFESEDVLRFNGDDYEVKATESFPDGVGGNQYVRLYLQ